MFASPNTVKRAEDKRAIGHSEQHTSQSSLRNASVPDPASSRRLWGLLRRKERWVISSKGRVALAIVAVATCFGVFLEIYPFLALTSRVSTNVLVVEGWVHNYAIEAAVKEFETGSYQQVFSTGGPVVGLGGYVNDAQTSASVGAHGLVKTGLAADLVQMVPSHVIGRDRTYNAALALRKWFLEKGMSVSGVNVVTETTHARRTRLLFQKAFGDNVRIGIISVPSPDYDPKHWWRYSEGVKEVITESAGYIYVRLFFYPSEFKPEVKVANPSEQDNKQ